MLTKETKEEARLIFSQKFSEYYQSSAIGDQEHIFQTTYRGFFPSLRHFIVLSQEIQQWLGIKPHASIFVDWDKLTNEIMESQAYIALKSDSEQGLHIYYHNGDNGVHIFYGRGLEQLEYGCFSIQNYDDL